MPFFYMFLTNAYSRLIERGIAMKGFLHNCLCCLLILVLLVALFSATAYADDVQTTGDINLSEGVVDSEYTLYLESIQDKDCANNSIKIPVSDETGENGFTVLENETLTLDFNIDEAARYNISLEYKILGENGLNSEISLRVNDKTLFHEMDSIELKRIWENVGVKGTDRFGNEIAPEQIECKEFITRPLYDSKGVIVNPYEFYFTQGEHKLAITAVTGDIAIKAVYLSVPDNAFATYEEISKFYSEMNYEKYNGEDIVIEGEEPFIKNSKSIVPLSDNSSASVNPANPLISSINYIGSTNWQNSTEEIVWKITVPKDGLYKLGFAFKQSQLVNGVSYRRLRIDGYTPFKEAASIPFGYETSWGFKTFDDGEEAYLFYLTEGEHQLSLAVTMGPTAEFYSQLEEINRQLGDLYIDIIMITGETPDPNFDYELFKQIPNFNETLADVNERLNSVISDMRKLSGNNTNNQIAALQNLSRVLVSMIENPYTAQNYLSDFYNDYVTVNSWLYEMTQMPLSIDQIRLAAPDKDFSNKRVNFFEKCLFAIKLFLASFSEDYNCVAADREKGTLEIWVNWGRDQAQILSNMIQDSFTVKTGIPVNLKIVNADLIKGMLSNNHPDLSLQLSRSAPVNFAMRGALYDLSNFPDYEEIMEERFLKSAGLPYEYNGGHYALPEQQSFYLMFYRTDILSELGIEVPNTWEEFLSATAVLQRNNMNSFIPYVRIASASTTDVGIGGLNLFASILMQSGGKFYNDELNKSTLTESSTLRAFTYWTNIYKEYKVPVEADFYNRFKIGTCPLGIATYSQYNTISQEAPEIKGRWGIALVPGTMGEDGRINRTVSGGGTGCAILEKSENKKEAWEFLKWWTDSETQVRYNNNVEAVLGSISRVCTANIDAFSKLGWQKSDLKILMAQLEEIQEIPEIPGSYFLSRSVDQAFWVVVNGKSSAKDALSKWGSETDFEIKRKIDEYK